MGTATLLAPTLHVEVLLKSKQAPHIAQQVCTEIRQVLADQYASLEVGQAIIGYAQVEHASLVQSVVVSDYTGPDRFERHHKLENLELDVQTYSLKTVDSADPRRRRISQCDTEQAVHQARVLPLPNVLLKDDWDSLLYDDALPSQVLRSLARMLGIMQQPGLNLSTFNWNRLCLLYGPPGSGKSTLCRALAQKLSIRLAKTFQQALLVEINTSSMLSKYFGESGKLIDNLFETILTMAQPPDTLVCVVMDEVETIAGSREKASTGGDCSDGLRATNQLLTALDRVRALPNIIILCTSNLIDAIDPAFLDRVDIKQWIPSPSPAAIYNIFQSCLNELVRSKFVDATAISVSSTSSTSVPISPATPSMPGAVTDKQGKPPSTAVTPSSSGKGSRSSALPIPSLPAVKIHYHGQPESPGQRVWVIAQKCEGFSGRTLRRLPILGLATYTWGGDCSLQDAISALEAAVDQELRAKQTEDVPL